MLTSEILSEKKYQDNFNNLVDAIKNHNCCAFIGAGLSRPSGYPLWPELMKIIKSEVENFNNDPIDDQSLNFYDRAELYKTILSENKFIEVILNIFDPHNDKQPCNEIHHDLISLPFASYITTNYDCTLENAARYDDVDIQYSYYPLLPSSKLREMKKQIFHIHGILDYDRLDETKGSIIITRSDIEEAYKKDSSIEKLLDTIFQELTILFIGFNTSDPFINEIFRKSIQQYNIKNEIAIKRSGEPLKCIRHFAFIENNYYVKRKEYNSFNPFESPEEEIVKSNESGDYDLELLGINPIRYDGDSYNHTQLIELVHGMKIQILGLQEEPIKYDKTFLENGYGN